jgi:predicted ATP-dependent endonuclease of OLD family
MIDTKRLDAIIPRSSHEERGVFRSGDATVSSSSITKYIDQIRIQVAEARRSSIQATQSADLSFAARALAAAKATVKEAALHKRYDEIVVKYEELARNGLAVGDAPLEFPEKTTPTVRRILSVFLDDWEKRLQPLGPLNKKIQTLRDILDTKLKQSGKRTSMGEGGQLMFRTFTGRRIRVSSLSSGEQHLVALFTHLLFTAAQGSVVLIDEPEISMHAAWKHAFLEDISRVADLADLQVILATHSTAIINGRWDLTEELGFSAETVPVDEEDNEPEVDSDDVLA